MTSSILKRALALHRAGDLTAAAAAYRRVLSTEPGNPDALHALGLIAHQSGRHDEAVTLIEEAITRQPNPAYWYNLGHVHLARQDPGRAETAFARAAALAPQHAEALFHLGNLRSRRGDVPGAIDAYRRAVAAKPLFVDARVNLALLLHQTDDAAEAIRLLEEALRLRPDDPDLHNSMGIVRGAVEPLRAIGDFRRALSLRPEHTRAAINLAKLLCSLQRHAEAIPILESVLARKPDDGETRTILANAFAEIGQLDDAVRQFEAVAAAMPESPRPLVSLGHLYLQFGRIDDACRRYRQARERDAADCEALVGILKRSTSPIPDDELERAARLATDPARSITERRQLHFALSVRREAMGDLDAAFKHMDEGNCLRRAELEPQKGPFDPARHAARIDRVIEAFDAAYFRRVAGFGVASERPVFVVGMPRSGTTLCEQILASHSQVFGAGELPDIARIERDLRRRFTRPSFEDDPAAYAAALTGDAVRAIAEDHLKRLAGLSPAASRIVDKMPLNYHRLGLIATLFPRAKIIHCRRDPLDTGLSCYSKDFTSFPLWACDLRQIGQVYRQYERLMAHWRRVLPIPILEFPYEDVVADLEPAARRLIGYCGLAWEDACLAFYRSARRVTTASLVQVRQPIYDSSIGRWRRFERYLAPLRDSLGER